MAKIKAKKYLSASLFLLSALFFLFFTTNPDDVEIAVLLIPVLTVFFLIFCAINFVLANMSHLGSPKRFLDSFAISSIFTLLLVLLSAGPTTVFDLVIVVVFIAISTIYIKKSIK